LLALYYLVCVVFEARVINLYDRDIATFNPSILMILLLSKLFPMAHGYIIKINITYIHIISNKLIHNNVNLPNNPTMIISTLSLQLIQPISKFIGHLIHPLIHNSQQSYNFISPSLWCHVIA